MKSGVKHEPMFHETCKETKRGSAELWQPRNGRRMVCGRVAVAWDGSRTRLFDLLSKLLGWR